MTTTLTKRVGLLLVTFELEETSDGLLVTRPVMWGPRKRSQVLPLTLDAFAGWRPGVLIQDAFPGLTADQREFLLSGLDGAEWDDRFPKEDDE